MKPHGKDPSNIIAVIPARYASERLPGKLLMELAGKPLIVHTAERAASANSVASVIVATDDERIRDEVVSAGFKVVMTSPAHASGSDRIAEVARELPEGCVIVNVQGDEPLIEPSVIDRAIDAMLSDDSVAISTTSEMIASAEQIMDPNVVKVVTNERGDALYFSRAPIPFARNGAAGTSIKELLERQPELLLRYRKHTGLYVYRRETLLAFSELPPSPLEQTERLEQLRALENGFKIRVVAVEHSSIGVDTAEDLEKVRAELKRGPDADAGRPLSKEEVGR